jgi:catalase-peroxidase
MGADFDYAAEFATVDLDALARDVDEVLTTSQEWWPADFGHYGPLVIRMVWHCAGTYRVDDGRGGPAAGLQRFAPLNSWPDNRNLDKARRLLWPVKRKYGRRISWADLMVFAGNRALETMGLHDLRLRRRPGGRLGARRGLLGSRARLARRRAPPRRTRSGEAAGRRPDGPHLRQPGGPEHRPRPAHRRPGTSATTFRRMGMNDEETVALIVGGHTFGKTHGAADPGAPPRSRTRGAPLEEQGPGLEEQLRHREGRRHRLQRLDGNLDAHPDQVGQQLPRDPVRLRVGPWS